MKDGVGKGQFQNGPLLEKLDVAFASRYLAALRQFRVQQQPTASWRIAFDAALRRYPIVVQHLLAGINAHINLDLGIAAAMTAPAGQLPGLQADFNQINGVLGTLVGTVEKEIAAISPLIGLLETFSLQTDTAIINFSLDKAREFAWLQATKMAQLSSSEMQVAIQELDSEVEILGKLVVSPPWLVKLQLFPIRLFETSNVRRVLEVLTSARKAAVAASSS